MKRYGGALIMGLTLFFYAKAKAGWPVGIFAGASSAMLALFIGASVRGRALRKAPEAPAMRPGERAILHGPVQLLEGGQEEECWAYLSDQRLSLLSADGGISQGFDLALVQELRPPRRRWLGHGPLGIVAQGRLWQLKVPDAVRWQQALAGALKAQG